MNMVEKIKITPLTVLNFATFFQYQRFVMPISFLFYLYNGLNFSQFILCQSIYSITCLIAKLLAGMLGDVFPKKYILIFSYICFMLRVILWINFSGFWIILTGEILYGLFKAFYRGNVDSYIYEYFENKNINKDILKGYGRLSSFQSLGSAISCIIGVILYKYIGFKGILYLELFTQIIAVCCLLMLPNYKTPKNYKNQVKSNYYLTLVIKSLKSVIKNTKVNYYVYYASLLSALTNVFVWNFQPLLKLSAAPVIMFGIISFINQLLRGVGGFFAKDFIKQIKSNRMLIGAEYTAVISSFVLLIAGYKIKNYVPVSIFIIIICIAIMLFVVFGIFNVSQIHKTAFDYRRAATSSVNTFFEDFASFFILLIFKFLYDAAGINTALVLFMLIFAIVLFPNTQRLRKTAL